MAEASAERGSDLSTLRQSLHVALQAARDRFDDVLGAVGAGEAVRQRAQLAERFRAGGKLIGDVVERFVAQDAAARHVLRLCQAFAPGGQFHQHGQRLLAFDAQLEALPCPFRIGIVGLGIGE